MKFEFMKRVLAMSVEELLENANRCMEELKELEKSGDSQTDDPHIYTVAAEYRYSMKLYNTKSGKGHPFETFEG